MGTKVSAGAAGTTNSALPVRLVLSMSSMLHTRQLLRMSYRQSPSICTAQEEEGGRQAGQRAAQAQMHTVIQSKGRQPNGVAATPTPQTHTNNRPPARLPTRPPAHLVDLRRLRLRRQRDHDVHVLQVKGGG